MRISDWSSDVCSSDLCADGLIISWAIPDEGATGRSAAQKMLEVAGLVLRRPHMSALEIRIEIDPFLDCLFIEKLLYEAAADVDLILTRSGVGLDVGDRSEDRRAGKEGGSTCRSRL